MSRKRSCRHSVFLSRVRLSFSYRRSPDRAASLAELLPVQRHLAAGRRRDDIETTRRNLAPHPELGRKSPYVAPADLRIARIVRTRVDSEHILQMPDEGSALLRWDAPLLLEVRLQEVFLSVRRTSSSEMVGPPYSSTNLAARSCMVQRLRPSGGSPHDRAMRCASACPSSPQPARSTPRGAPASRVRSWKQALLLVQPETLLRWHRQGVHLIWKAKSARGPAQPRLPEETRTLIITIATENRQWGGGAYPRRTPQAGHSSE